MEILTDKVIYHTETQEDYDDLMKKLEKLGCEWCFGGKLNWFNEWFKYTKETCILLNCQKVSYGNKHFFEKDYSEIEVVQYKKEQNPMEVKLKADQKFIADWYENHKDDLDYYIFEEHADISNLNKADIAEDKFLSWMYDSENNPVQTLVKMHLFGYEIEPEKLYTVEIPNPNNIGNEFLVLMRNGFNQIVALTKSGKEWRNQNAFKLTENEIKKDFAWAWDFAKQV